MALAVGEAGWLKEAAVNSGMRRVKIAEAGRNNYLIGRAAGGEHLLNIPVLIAAIFGLWAYKKVELKNKHSEEIQSKDPEVLREHAEKIWDCFITTEAVKKSQPDHSHAK